MEITYKTIKDFDSKALEELFLSFQWLSGRYPKRLQKALRGSSTVCSAWDRNRLIGLINALDDGEMTAYIHYLLVHPDYQGHGLFQTKSTQQSKAMSAVSEPTTGLFSSVIVLNLSKNIF